ncbi:MAG: hypothetical protein CME59_18790 [Halioglobus sp.]|nr:hypothetical protein [Halioglobus sp.]|tara:strand:+ start:3254 stop:3928 length:675 start_codon:yes stop_codon:yes gene_type:complete
MTESLLSKVTRIVTGSINHLVESAEGAAPEIVMAEAIREIESAIGDVRDELGKVKAQKHNANLRLVSENNRHEELTEKIKLALQEGREDLGEAAVQSQLDIEAQLPLLEKTIADCSDREKELENYILALQGRRREMEDELAQAKATLAESTGSGEAAVRPESGAGSVDKAVERANSTFDRVARGITGTPGAAAHADPAKIAELEELARRHRIKERLEKFKREQS